MDDEFYLDAWKEMCEKLERILDCKVLGFDPSFTVVPNDNPYAPAFNIPFWVAEKVIELGGRVEDLERYSL
jgi:hypothetical protein